MVTIAWLVALGLAEVEWQSLPESGTCPEMDFSSTTNRSFQILRWLRCYSEFSISCSCRKVQLNPTMGTRWPAESTELHSGKSVRGNGHSPQDGRALTFSINWSVMSKSDFSHQIFHVDSILRPENSSIQRPEKFPVTLTEESSAGPADFKCSQSRQQSIGNESSHAPACLETISLSSNFFSSFFFSQVV